MKTTAAPKHRPERVPQPRAPRSRLGRAASAAPWGVTPQAARGGYFAVGFLLKKSGMLNFSGTPMFDAGCTLVGYRGFGVEIVGSNK